MQKRRAAEKASIDQVRDLLFGHQLQEVHARIEALQTNLDTGLQRLREQFEGAHRDLESALREQLGALEHDLSGGIEALRQETEQRLGDLDAKMALQERELRHDLDERATRLQEEKADRLALAELLETMAAGLRGEGRD